MKHVLKTAILLLILSACAPQYHSRGVSKKSILMQNPYTGKVKACHSYYSTAVSMFNSASDCASMLASRGWFNVRQEQRRAASYDVVVGAGYPARRWHNGENSPRW